MRRKEPRSYFRHGNLRVAASSRPRVPPISSSFGSRLDIAIALVYLVSHFVPRFEQVEHGALTVAQGL